MVPGSGNGTIQAKIRGCARACIFIFSVHLPMTKFYTFRQQYITLREETLKQMKKRRCSIHICTCRARKKTLEPVLYGRSRAIDSQNANQRPAHIENRALCPRVSHDAELAARHPRIKQSRSPEIDSLKTPGPRLCRWFAAQGKVALPTASLSRRETCPFQPRSPSIRPISDTDLREQHGG